ncbi:MAG: alpha/beta hydrolase [Verrucomicrobiota bacterium]
MKKILWAGGVMLLAAMYGRAAELTVADAEVRKELGRDCPVVYLWPEGKVPDEPRPIDAESIQPGKQSEARTIRNVSRPSMTIIAPPADKNTGVALVLGPGGGYVGLGYRNVTDVARLLNARGITVVLLKYRVPRRGEGFTKDHQPLQDAQRALGILRTRAAEWGIDPKKIGIGGFSAGGHMGAALANNFEPRLYPALDEADKTSCRPDFAVLLAPAYLTGPIESRTPDPKLRYGEISAKKTPPTFIAITMPDKFTTGATEYMLALTKAKVNAEMHVYPTGEHGAGIAKDWLAEWSVECLRWLADAGFLGPKPTPEKFTYKASSLAESPVPAGLTEGDWKLKQILGREVPVIPLWPEGGAPDDPVPGAPAKEVVAVKSRGGTALNITQVARPTLLVVSPSKAQAKPNGRAVIIMPGGGYGGLAAEHEGVRVAEWLNEQGITGIVLKYRVPSRKGFEKHHHALQDAQRAMRMVRSRAAEWGLDPKKIGVMGFSAGGHAAAMLCTSFDREAYPAKDDIDRVSCRPDFGLPIYAAYLTEPTDSDTIAADFKDRLKREATPPLFFAVAKDDRFSRGVLNFYLEVRAAQVPAEMHIYNAGGHGGGIDPISYPTSEWTRAAARWLSALDATK